MRVKWLVLNAPVRLYRSLLSPVLHWMAGPGYGCRFYPSCGQYFGDAVESHGAIRGGWLGMKRVCRCHPWGGSGFDPVPRV